MERELSDASNSQKRPSASGVRDGLSRVLSSEEFHDSDRLSAFLRYVVEESLAGRADRIKATSIAMDVFKRGADEDLVSDSIVRVTASRLRRKLSHHYSNAGQSDPVRIDIATGTYVPTFASREDIAEESQVEDAKLSEREKTHDLTLSHWRNIAASLLVVAAFVVIAWIITESRNSAQVQATKPFVVVLPLEGSGDSEISRKISTGYLEAVIANLSKLSGLSVMATRSSKAAAKSNTPLELLRKDQGVTHVVKGTFVTQSERVRVSVQLIDTDTKAVIFAERFDGKLSNIFELEDKLANRIAAALSVTLDPSESQRIYLRHTSNREAIRLVRRATVSINPPNERGRIEAARALNQSVIVLDPNFPGGYAGLSQVHSYMVLFRHTSQPEYDLEQAVELAQKAIELDDKFGLGHSMLGLAYSIAGKMDLALSHVRRAVALEPGDPLAYQWLSGVLIFAGRTDEAVSAIIEALRLDPIEPGTPYLNILGMAYFNLEQYDKAAAAFERNILKGGPEAPNMEAYRAATYAALGRETDARNVLAKLNVKSGEIIPEAWIRQWTPSEDLAQMTIASLYGLGMRNRDNASPGFKSTPSAANPIE